MFSQRKCFQISAKQNISLAQTHNLGKLRNSVQERLPKAAKSTIPILAAPLQSIPPASPLSIPPVTPPQSTPSVSSLKSSLGSVPQEKDDLYRRCHNYQTSL
ncbi:hypothetical protein EMCRGX_G023309 [Ephydatia muelleri]